MFASLLRTNFNSVLKTFLIWRNHLSKSNSTKVASNKTILIRLDYTIPMPRHGQYDNNEKCFCSKGIGKKTMDII
jgi:hypothetical protein